MSRALTLGDRLTSELLNLSNCVLMNFSPSFLVFGNVQMLRFLGRRCGPVCSLIVHDPRKRNTLR
jgi:hypothetical protein